MLDFGPGGQRFAERELGWNRRTIRMGVHELRTGVQCVAAFNARGRKPIDARLPNLRADIKDIEAWREPSEGLSKLNKRRVFGHGSLGNSGSSLWRMLYHRLMNKQHRSLGIAAVAWVVPACSKGPTVPVVAVGKVGQRLSAHVADVPQGAAVCAHKRALEDPRSKDEEPVAEACKDAAKSDEPWRRSMGVLAAYGENISEIAFGTDPGSSGRLEANQS